MNFIETIRKRKQYLTVDHKYDSYYMSHICKLRHRKKSRKFSKIPFSRTPYENCHLEHF